MAPPPPPPTSAPAPCAGDPAALPPNTCVATEAEFPNEGLPPGVEPPPNPSFGLDGDAGGANGCFVGEAGGAPNTGGFASAAAGAAPNAGFAPGWKLPIAGFPSGLEPLPNNGLEAGAPLPPPKGCFAANGWAPLPNTGFESDLTPPKDRVLAVAPPSVLPPPNDALADAAVFPPLGTPAPKLGGFLLSGVTEANICLSPVLVPPKSALGGDTGRATLPPLASTCAKSREWCHETVQG